jgi:hypothetical protein
MHGEKDRRRVEISTPKHRSSVRISASVERGDPASGGGSALKPDVVVEYKRTYDCLEDGKASRLSYHCERTEENGIRIKRNRLHNRSQHWSRISDRKETSQRLRRSILLLCGISYLVEGRGSSERTTRRRLEWLRGHTDGRFKHRLNPTSCQDRGREGR